MKLVTFKVLIFFAIISGFLLVPPHLFSAQYLTSPLYNHQVNSWFDHTSPKATYINATDTSPIIMTRYDGTTGWSYNGHAGTDLKADIGDDVLAASSGSVGYAGLDICGGYYIRLWHPSYGQSTYYFHLDHFIVTSGLVNQSQIIAESGDTGQPGKCINGPHLHFEARNGQPPAYPIDPYGWAGSGQPNLTTADPTDFYTSDPWPYNQGYLWTTNPPSLTPPPGSTVYVTGNITQDTTWGAGVMYVVQSSITVDPGVTLTLSPGAMIKFGTNGYLSVSGIINAVGSSNNKIYITSIKDDTVGGDTNGDGSATLPVPADYAGIMINQGATGTFDYDVFKYGGKTQCCQRSGVIQNLGGTVTVKNSQFTNNWTAIDVESGLGTTIDASMISNSTQSGIYIFATASTPVTLTNSIIAQNGAYGIYATTITPSVLTLTVAGNTFTSNTPYDAQIGSGVNFINSGNTVSGNGPNGFGLMGIPAGSQVWNPGVPFVMLTAWNHYTVPFGQTLTINPGVIVKFASQGVIDVYGTLTTQRTAMNKAYFTSIKDDSIGGDTNGDGSATSPAINDYAGIFFFSGSNGLLNETIIKYGGDVAYASLWQYGNIRVDGGNVNVVNSEITDNSDAFYVLSGSLFIDQSEVKRNVGNGIYGITLGSDTASITVLNTIFGDNDFGDASLSGSFDLVNSGNKTGGTKQKGFRFPGGTPPVSQTWNPGVPYIIGPISSGVSGYTIPLGTTLTINPGTIVKFDTNGHIDVYGYLNADGTKLKKIQFTSQKDDAVGGDTNGNGNATAPAPGDYQGIEVFTGGNVFIDQAILRYGGRFECCGTYQGVIRVNGGVVNISNSRITNNDHGIYDIGGQTSVTQSAIFGNYNYSVYNTGVNQVSAVSNWWGDPSGPYHPTLNPGGKGDTVSNNVTFTPWLSSDPTLSSKPGSNPN